MGERFGKVPGGRSVVTQASSVAVDYAMDLAMIQRNVRDLAKTASYSHMDDIEELHQLAYTNLKTKMSGGFFAEDPTLCLEAYRVISAVRLQTIEVKRKAADTLIKARCLIDPSIGAVPVGSEEDPLDGFEEEGVIIQEGGVFAGVDVPDDEADVSGGILS
jgi:hypothetical protein